MKQISLHRVTPRTITSRRVFENQLRTFRRLGYTWEIEEGELGVTCVAAPLFGPLGEVFAAASLTGTTQQIPKSRLAQTATLVRRYAQMMSARLGAIPESNSH